MGIVSLIGVCNFECGPNLDYFYVRIEFVAGCKGVCIVNSGIPVDKMLSSSY